MEVTTSELRYKLLAGKYLKAVGYDVEAECPTLRHWRNNYWKYVDGRYIMVRPDDLKLAMLSHFMATEQSDNIAVIAKAERALAALMDLPAATQQPSWLGDGQPFTTSRIITTRSAIIDYDEQTLADVNPRWFTTMRIPVIWQPEASCPRWLAWLTEKLRPSDITALQQWFGYVVSGRTNCKKAAFLRGQGDTGKSTVLRIITALIGQDNTSTRKLSQFHDKWSAGFMFGKALNISDEVGELTRNDETAFKEWTGGGAVSFEWKGDKTAIDAIPSARLMISVNEWPTIHDQSDAVYNRMLCIPFTVPHKKIDLTVEPGLLEELPGILRWSLEGLRNLEHNNWSFPTTTGESEVRGMMGDNRPTMLFVDDWVRSDAEGFISNADLKSYYKKWADANGYNPQAQPARIKSDIRDRHPNTKEVTRRDSCNNVARGIGGVRIERP